MPFWLLAAVDWVFCRIEFQRMKTSESDAAEELTQLSKSKHEIDPRLAKPVSLGILKAHLGDRVFYVACNGGKEALMNDYGNKAMHAKRASVRHLAISHTSTTIPAPQHVDTYLFEKFSLHAII